MQNSAPLCYLTDEDSLRFYLLNVGEGLMHLLILPDQTTLLFDCNVTNENEDEILNFLSNCLPEKSYNIGGSIEQPIDVFINSHRDEDHYRGLKIINEKFPIKSIWDSGQSGATTSSPDYQYYMSLRRKLKETGNSHVLVPSDVPVNFGEVEIYCLAAERDFQSGYENHVRMAMGKEQHTNSIVLLVKYCNRKLLLTGDSDWKSWKESIVPNFNTNSFLKTDILIASHHGSRSFFTNEQENEHINEMENPDSTYIDSIKIINPIITLISCDSYNVAHHPNKEALKLYNQYTALEQVYTTSKLGHICGFIDRNGYFSVIPSRFCDKSNPSSAKLAIKCLATKNGIEAEINCGGSFETGSVLKFSIASQGGLIEPMQSIKATWEVSNCGVKNDEEHHEIYYKGEEEKDGVLRFSRELSYKGRHFLRCKIYNSHKHISATKIFWINGI